MHLKPSGMAVMQPCLPELAAYLNSAAVNSRTDDDKTLIIAVLP